MTGRGLRTTALDKWQVNRLFKIPNIFKTGAFTFGFETLLPSSCLSHLTLLVCLTSLFLSVSPHSSCLSHLTLLVSQLDSLSSRNKLNLICDARLSFVQCAALKQFSLNCSVCSLTELNYFYYYKKKNLNDGEGRCHGGQVT